MKHINLIFLVLFTTVLISCSNEPLEDEFQNSEDPIDQENPSDEDPTDEDPGDTEKLIKKLSFSGAQDYTIEFYYNDENKIEKLITTGAAGDGFIKKYYYSDGKIDKAEFQTLEGIPTGSIEQYIYNNGSLTERQDFHNSILNETFVFSFTEDLIGSISYIGTNQTEYSEQIIFQYDENNNIISRLTDRVYNPPSDEERTFSYDTKNSPFLYFEPKIVLIDDFTSFVNNALTETRINLTDNSIISEDTFIYTYDQDNFPIEKNMDNGSIIFEYY